MPVTADTPMEVRVALLELGQANVLAAIKDLKGDVANIATSSSRTSSKITGWLIGACFTLTTSSILLALNLVH